MDPSFVAMLPAHGICLTSVPEVIALSAWANALIGLSYFAISFIMYYLRSEIYKISYFKTFLWLWISFVSLCGATHISKAVLMYQGGWWYYVDLIMHTATMVVSVSTAVFMFLHRRRILKMLEQYLDADCRICYRESNINPKPVEFTEKKT